MLPALFPSADNLDGWIDESIPWLAAWLFVLALAIAIVLVANGIQHLRSRSPVDKLLRQRLGRGSLGEGGFG